MSFLLKYKQILSEETFECLRHCNKSMDSEENLSVGVWGAVFLESFLTDIFKALSIGRGSHEDLNGKIQVLRNYSKNAAPEKVAVPDEIIKRCDEIRNIRNRLVHATGMKKSTLKTDAASILGGINVILKWYLSISEPKEALPEGLNQTKVPTYTKGRIFLSTISPHSEDQKYFLALLEEQLNLIGVEVVRVESTIYDKHDPIGKIRTTIESCDGMLVVGLERSHAYFLKEKEGSASEVEAIHRKFTSGWLHLEAGIANALKLPVFIICEKGIHSDGIFDRHWNSYPVVELDSIDGNCDAFKQLMKHIEQWTPERKVLDV